MKMRSEVDKAMNKRITGVIILAAMIGVLMGCGSSKPQIMKLSLDSNPTTGYSWTIKQEPEIFEVGEEYIENKHEEGMVGVGGQQVFSLAPKEAGTSDVTFTYARPWEDPDADSTVVSYTVKVSQNMQIQVESSRYAGGNDMDELPQIPEPVIE